MRNTSTHAVAEAKKSASVSQPKFSFTGAAGWRKGPSNDVSMALFGNERADRTSACFTSIEYKSGTVNVQSELQEMVDGFKSQGTMLERAPVPSILHSAKGDKQYDLHQFNAVSANKEVRVMGGVEVGYVQLDTGYVKISGNCETFDELPSTIPALQGYKLN